MTIADKLQALVDTKEGIKTALTNKGADVSATPFTEYPAVIAELSTGGGDYPVGTIANWRLDRDDPNWLPCDGSLILSADYPIIAPFLPDVSEHKLTASDGASNDLFGYSVAISADGATALIGAYQDDGKGAAYVFTLQGGAWIETTKLTASDGASTDIFGYSVSISADGATALISAHQDDDKGSNSGSAYVFTLQGGTWVETAKLVASDGAANDRFGHPVSISSDGATALVGANGDDDKGSNSGSAYVFTSQGGTWVETAKLTASDGASSDIFGSAVSISADGTTAIVGAYQDDDKGSNSGSAYVFTLQGGTWVETAKLIASDGAGSDFFGCSVAISADGTTALIGAYNHNVKDSNPGSAYVLTLQGGTWVETAKLIASDGAGSDRFGYSVSISTDGTTALIGAYFDDDKGSNSGSAYAFTLQGGTWVETTKLTASDGDSYDFLGHSISISADGATALIGAYQDDDKGANSGSAYIRRMPELCALPDFPETAIGSGQFVPMIKVSNNA